MECSQWSTTGKVSKAYVHLKAAFHDNPRCVALVHAFSEGVALYGVGSSDRVAVAVNQQANGFELLRQLTLEFSLRSRSEALSLRTQIAGRSFVLAATQTSPSSLVSDTIRRIDYEVARFSRLLGTLPMQVDTTGLKLADSDMLVVLLKSLPETVKNYVLLRALGTPAAHKAPPQTGTLAQRALEEWERTLCENKAVAILAQMQAGRPALIQKDGGEMLIAIVLDKPLAEAKALVDDPAASVATQDREPRFRLMFIGAVTMGYPWLTTAYYS